MNIKVCLAILLVFWTFSASDEIDCGNYRIAISHDGNDHDLDDIVAAPMSLAVVTEAGVQDKLVHMTYSNHIWGDKGNQPERMKESVDGAVERWGVDPSIVFEARVPAQLKAAKEAFKKAVVETFDAGATLYYASGGPMEVPYQMLEGLEKKYRDIVTVVSHGTWNDEHQHNGSRTWQDLIKIAGKNLHTKTQNSTVWNNSLSSWLWFKDLGTKYAWLYDRNPFDNKFDPSDAGMMYYIVTGRGNQDAQMTDVKWLFQNKHQCDPVPLAEGFQGTKKPGMSVYSVPFQGQIEIIFHNISDASKPKLTVYDVIGKEVLQRPIDAATRSGKKLILDVGGMLSGVYFLRLSAGKDFFVKKVIVD